MQRRQRFVEHAVFITGASSGIGAALARQFAAEGADVALLARRRDRLEALAADIQKTGRRAAVIACDVSRDGDLERATGEARAAFGKIDVVVANAGFGVVGSLETLALEDYRRQLETNLFGVLRTVYATLEDLKRTRGRLVLVGSVSGHLGVPGSSAYTMSKFAVRGLAESLGHELAAYGVTVTLISPGFVESELSPVDTRGVYRPAARRRPIPKLIVMSAERAARKIVTAVARRRREAVITGFGKLAVFLQRHAPWLVATGISRFAIKGRREPR